MAVEWTKHRFSGGKLALDVANTVVLRRDPRGFDRFAEADEIVRFAQAASVYRAEELGGQCLMVDEPASIHVQVVEARESVDASFRAAAVCGYVEDGALARLLRACAALLETGCAGAGGAGFSKSDPAEPPAISFTSALSHSALSLLAPEQLSRIRICGNCGWLFLDRSRNASRVWCDMAVCGNRRKAKRHYAHRTRRREDLDVQ